MIKNFSKVLLGLGLLSAVNIATASPLTDMIQKQTGQKVSLVKEQKLSQDSNLKLVTLKDDASGMRILGLSNTSESMFLAISQAFFTANDKDRELIVAEYGNVGNYNMTFKSQAAVKKVIATLPKEHIIDLKGKNPKRLFYIVSDPLCPHCQVELANIDKRLEQGDVKMIPIGMMGEESARKVAEIHAKIKSAKSDADKIAILKKIYDRDHKAEGFEPKELEKIKEVARNITGKGKVEGTPYIIEEDR